MVGYGVAPGWGLFVAPLVLAMLMLAAVGVGALLSALTVAFRDFRYIVPFTVQLWMFATPAIYLRSESTFGPHSQALLALNPTHGLIAAFRQAVLGGEINWQDFAVSGGVSVFLFVAGCLCFRRVERMFADII
jgi:lipopolysaccharide transport system permease protein